MPQDFGRVQLYVDTAYVREELKRLGIDPWFGPRELFRPLLNIRIEGKLLSIWRVIFYDAIDEQAPTVKEHKEYLDTLGKLPDTLVRLGSVTGTRNKRQKGVDMRMGSDMEEAARTGLIEYIALVSGDADFIPVVQKIENLGPKVLVLAFNSSVSGDLVREADRFIELPENPDRIWAIDKS